MLWLGPTSVHKTTLYQNRCEQRRRAQAWTALRATARLPQSAVTLTTFESQKAQSAAAANAAQHLFDSLLPRKLLGLQLIPFSRAPLRPWPGGSRSRTGDIAGIGGNGRLRPWRRDVRLRRHRVAHSLRLLGFGSNRLMSRRAAAKARPHPDQQKSDVKSNHSATPYDERAEIPPNYAFILMFWRISKLAAKQPTHQRLRSKNSRVKVAEPGEFRLTFSQSAFSQLTSGCYLQSACSAPSMKA
jgi:hypothetical protein